MQIELEEMNQPALEKAIKLVHRLTGISMGNNKKTLIQGRLRPRIRALSLNSYDQYFDLLNNNEKEIQIFINLITTNETSFFRTQRVWDYFQQNFLTDWSAQNYQKPLRIWSGASSSGEEIYTIAICCEEHLLKNPGFSYMITGTDISTAALEQANAGIYNGRSIETFKTNNRSLFDKYLEASSENFKVKEFLKTKIKFKPHNLFLPPNDTFDLVFLRNVLIYFDQPDQEKVLAHIGNSLTQNGTLIIGESESLNSLKTPFEFFAPLIYKNKGSKV